MYVLSFVSIKWLSQGHAGEPGGECHVLPTVLQPGDLKFKNQYSGPHVLMVCECTPVPAICFLHLRPVTMHII